MGYHTREFNKGTYGEFSKVEEEWEELLDASFGHTINSNGYRVLNNVRVIQGDGINLDSLGSIRERANSGR